jgi:rhodanese-related sulfurtransferase/predicted transcriptional regulator
LFFFQCQEFPGSHDGENTENETEADRYLVGQYGIVQVHEYLPAVPQIAPSRPPAIIILKAHYSIDCLNTRLADYPAMSNDNFKHALFTQFARVGKALSNANRLELLEFIAQGERSVDELAKVSGLTVANTSQHLQQLRQAGLVVCRKLGLKVFYSLSGNDVVTLLNALRGVAGRHVADVEKLVNTYLTVKDDLEPLPRQELLERVRDGLVTVLDVRPPEEYAAGHIAGAENVQLSELEQYLENMDTDQEIVAYCRGPHCVLAFDAVARLRKQGLKARRLEDGYPEWKTAGLPVETGII